MVAVILPVGKKKKKKREGRQTDILPQVFKEINSTFPADAVEELCCGMDGGSKT